MALLDTTKLRIRNYVGKRLFGLGKEPDQTYQIGKYTDDRKGASYLDSYEGVTFACVSAIAEEVGRYQPEFYRPNGEQVLSHPLLSLFANPQPDDADSITQYDLFEAMSSFYDLQGEVFLYLPYGQYTKQPKEIHILRADRMGVSIDDNGNVDGYYLRRSTGSPIPFTINEIIHHKRFNPKNPYRGMGIIEAGLDYIETEQSTTQFTKNFFLNNAGVSGVLNIKGEVSRNAFKKFARAWREKYQGVDNAGKVAIVRDSDATFTKIGLGLDELDMDALKKMTKEDIFMMFRTPRGLFGLSDDTGLGRASVETLEYIFAKRTIEPRLEKLDGMVLKMLQRYYPKDQILVDHQNIIPADKAFELQYRDKAVDRWLTRDEIREDDGLNEIEGADQLFVALNQIPVNSSATPSAATEAKTLKFVKNKDGKFTLVAGKKKDSSPEVNNTDNDYERKEQFRSRLERNKNAYAKKYRTAFVNVLRDQEDTVKSRITHLGKDLASQLFELSDANGQIEQAMYPVLVDMALEQGALALLFAGDDETEFRITGTLENNIRRNTERMANNFNKQTLADLQETLIEGITAGESLQKLTKRVESVYDDATGYRAERVARTESSFATGDATLDAYRQTGYVVGKQWFANPGACQYCSELDGTSVGLEDSFVTVGDSVTGTDGGQYDVTYDDVTSAELHPNCNCTIIPVREEL